MIKEFNILATTKDELLYLVPLANCDEINFPAYVYYNDGLTDSIFSGTLDLSFITFEEYVSLENMFNLRKINGITPNTNDQSLFFDNEERKVFSSDINLEEENPDKFTMLPNGTTSITEGTYLGYNEVITFINKYGEIYDFSQKCWVGHLILVDYTNILWESDHKVEVYKPKLESEAKKETEKPKNSLPERKDCDIVINYRNETSFYRFPTIVSDYFSFQVFDRERNEWVTSKIGYTTIFKMIDEDKGRLIHLSELGRMYLDQYNFNNKFTKMFNSISNVDYGKMTDGAKSLLSLLKQLK